MSVVKGFHIGCAVTLAVVTGSLGGLAAPKGAASAAQAGQADVRLEPVGYHDLGGDGLNADVWLHRGVAYVGTDEEDGDPERGCLGLGVKVVDLTDPTRPELVAHPARHPGTTAENMRDRAVETPAFRGDLLAVGLQACADDGLRGVELWDVTSPRAPRHLSYFEVLTAEADPRGGVHELDLVQRADGRVLALLAVPFSERKGSEKLGDLRVVDVTDPSAPRPLAAWGAGRLGSARMPASASNPRSTPTASMPVPTACARTSPTGTPAS